MTLITWVGMDPRFSVSRDEFYSVQMDVKQMQMIQNNHAERISRLEKHQANDAAIKSVWNSPFPSALSGTPQHGPLQMPPNEIFDDFEEQGQSLLGSLHLDAEDEPARRGAASRANSVRFDESALQGSSWAQNGRHSGDFGPIRPGSGLGNHNMMERSLSHKSDGRHSSAGHSVHSHHSIASGRGSSLGIDTTFTPAGQDDDSPIGIPEPPPSLFVLGSVPSIIRCWLAPNFAHDTLLYAVVCTGSQKSVVEFSLIKELDLTRDIHRDLDGVHRIRLPVYLTEATVSQPSSRGMSPAPQIPSLTCTFEVAGVDLPDNIEAKKTIRTFIGSEALREHCADILFSQNRMTLYSSEREKLSVPFVRPEDSGIFKHIRTMAIFPEKPKLNATARPFVLGEAKSQATTATESDRAQTREVHGEDDARALASPSSELASQQAATAGASSISESGGESERHYKEMSSSESGTKEPQVQPNDTPSDHQRRSSAAGSIWNSWRHGPALNGNEQKDASPLSGYQPAGRGVRSMKVLKSTKSATSSSSARTGTSYEPASTPKSSVEPRRKSHVGADSFSNSSTSIRWESKRAVSSSVEPKANTTTREARSASGTPRTSTNPIGSASAFSWMSSSGKPRTPTAAAE